MGTATIDLLGYTEGSFEYESISTLPDDRMIHSRIVDISKFDNYDEYVKLFFEEYEEELFN